MADNKDASLVSGVDVNYVDPNLAENVGAQELPNTAADFWKQREQQLSQFDKNVELDATKRANSQDVVSSQYTQSPSVVPNGLPALNSLESLIQNPTTPVTTGRINAVAQEIGKPLTPAQTAYVAGETFVPPQAMGTAASVAAPQTTVQPIAQQSSTDLSVQQQSYPFADSYNLAKKSIEVGEKAGLELAAAKNKFAEQQLMYEQEAADKAQKLQDAFDVQYQEKLDDLNNNVKELRQLAGEKIIPGAYLARQDTQAAMMTGLSIALGSLASAYTGSNQNIGLEMVNKAIDRDVEAQRFSLDTKQRLKAQELSANQNLLSLMRQKFGDDKSAVLATKASMLAMAEDKFNAEITKRGGFSDMSTRASALQALSQLRSQREVYEMQLKQQQQQQYSMMEMLKGADKYNLTTEQAQAIYGEKGAEKYVQGFGLALSKEDKAKFQETFGESKSSLDALDKLLTMDMNKLSPEKRAEVATELNLLTGKMRLAVLGPGAMTEKEYSRLIETLGDPNAFIAFPGTQMKKLQTVRNRLKTQQDGLVKQYFGNKTFQELEQSKGKINFK